MAEVFNNGNGGSICDQCRTMIKNGSRQIHKPVLAGGQEFCSVKCQKRAEEHAPKRLIYGFEKPSGALASAWSRQEITESVMLDTPEDELPTDYEVCGSCGFDHEYDVIDPAIARKIQEVHELNGD